MDSCPILLDPNGDGIQLTTAEDGVSFDLRPDGTHERLAWTRPGSDDAFLALDRNGNGLIDDGHELFGNYTPQHSSDQPNGFRALAVYDSPAEGGNRDGEISRSDAIFQWLLLWRDADHDGISQPSEITPLSLSGLDAIDLKVKDSKKRDEFGNLFRFRSRVDDSTDLGKWAYDVFLRRVR